VSRFAAAVCSPFIPLIYLSPFSSSRIHSALLDHIRKVSLIADAPFIHAARPLVPHIEALARRIAGLADINRAVHTPTYNRLIASAVADEDAEQ